MSLPRFLAAMAFASACLAAPSAFAHAKLQSSTPAPNSALDSAPKQIRLQFNEALEPAFSSIKLTGPQDKPIPLAAGNVDKADPTVMTAPLPPLPAGQYHVRWTAMSHDGHKVKGEVVFTVK
jgi:methionine-rich copper-binding protein CopC